MQTVREYLVSNTDIAGVHMMTPFGYVDLSAKQITEILKADDNEKIEVHFGCRGMGTTEKVKDILSQVICTDIDTLEDGSTSFLADIDRRK